MRITEDLKAVQDMERPTIMNELEKTLAIGLIEC